MELQPDGHSLTRERGSERDGEPAAAVREEGHGNTCSSASYLAFWGKKIDLQTCLIFCPSQNKLQMDEKMISEVF